jgi:hypothetical protein
MVFVGSHKMHIFTVNIPTFHSRYRRLMLITNKFHEFCWFTISGTSDDGKASYGPKFIHIFIMYKPRVVTDNMTWGDDVAQSPGSAEPKWGRLAPPPWPAGEGLTCFRNPISPHVKLSRQEENPKWERRCSYKTWPPGHLCHPTGLTSGPPKPQLWPRHRLNPLINTPMLLLTKGVKKVRFSPI